MHRLRVLAPLCLLLSCAPHEVQKPFVVRVAAGGELAPFHPRTFETSTAAALDLAYQPILRVGEDGRLRPGAVRAWERVGAGRVRVQVDPELRFSDGSPVRVEDLISSLSGSGLEIRSGGEWLEIGPGASRDPLDVTLLYSAVFKHAAPVPLGTGPFRYVEGDARHIVLERVRPVPGRVARVEIVAAPTPRDAFAWALRGEVNAVMSLDARQSELLEGVPSLRIIRGESPHAVTVVMNAARLSREERLALAGSLPRSELIRAYGGGCGSTNPAEANGPVPPGRPLQVAVSTHDAGLPRLALALRRALGARGGDVVAEPVLRSSKRAAGGDFDLLVTGLLAWPPVMLGGFARSRAAMNWVGYSNTAVDAAFDAGDPGAALAEMARDPPLVIVCRRQRIAAVDARIKNPSLGTWGVLDTLPEWEVGP